MYAEGYLVYVKLNQEKSLKKDLTRARTHSSLIGTTLRPDTKEIKIKQKTRGDLTQ